MGVKEEVIKAQSEIPRSSGWQAGGYELSNRTNDQYLFCVHAHSIACHSDPALAGEESPVINKMVLAEKRICRTNYRTMKWALKQVQDKLATNAK